MSNLPTLPTTWRSSPGAFSADAYAILDAYADGRLIDRDTINYEAAWRQYDQPWLHENSDDMIRAIVNAAIGDDDAAT